MAFCSFTPKYSFVLTLPAAPSTRPSTVATDPDSHKQTARVPSSFEIELWRVVPSGSSSACAPSQTSWDRRWHGSQRHTSLLLSSATGTLAPVSASNLHPSLRSTARLVAEARRSGSFRNTGPGQNVVPELPLGDRSLVPAGDDCDLGDALGLGVDVEHCEGQVDVRLLVLALVWTQDRAAVLTRHLDAVAQLPKS